MARRPSIRSLPLALLAVLSVLSFATRAAWLGEPCRAPCHSASDHQLIFDETYYVNAARVIAGVTAPVGSPYLGAPLGDDPNAEHPQLAKLAMAGSIELFGDGPLAWRLPSLLFGSLAIAGMFALVRAAGGGQWPALGAAALMASDNLLIVHGRIATLDVYVLAAMIWAAVLYLRGRTLSAGALIGIGASFKLVGPYVLAVVALYELLSRRAPGAGPPAARVLARLATCTAVAVAVFAGLLAALDRLAPPYDMTAGRPLSPGPVHHVAHMLSYAAKQTSPHGPHGIASYPWQWLVDLKPIVYLNINPPHPSPGLRDIRPAVHFLGMVSPPIMLLAAPALLLIGWQLLGASRWAALSLGRRQPAAQRGLSAEPGNVAILGLAWFLGTFLPFLALSLLWKRTSYLYYMVVVMPGIYLAVVELLFAARRHRRLVAVWILSVLVAAVLMYPLTPLP